MDTGKLPLCTEYRKKAFLAVLKLRYYFMRINTSISLHKFEEMFVWHLSFIFISFVYEIFLQREPQDPFLNHQKIIL